MTTIILLEAASIVGIWGKKHIRAIDAVRNKDRLSNDIIKLLPSLYTGLFQKDLC
jgi:hypothetical protein